MVTSGLSDNITATFLYISEQLLKAMLKCLLLMHYMTFFLASLELT